MAFYNHSSQFEFNNAEVCCAALMGFIWSTFIVLIATYKAMQLNMMIVTGWGYALMGVFVLITTIGQQVKYVVLICSFIYPSFYIINILIVPVIMSVMPFESQYFGVCVMFAVSMIYPPWLPSSEVLEKPGRYAELAFISFLPIMFVGFCSVNIVIFSNIKLKQKYFKNTFDYCIYFPESLKAKKEK